MTITFDLNAFVLHLIIINEPGGYGLVFAKLREHGYRVPRVKVGIRRGLLTSSSDPSIPLKRRKGIEETEAKLERCSNRHSEKARRRHMTAQVLRC